MIKLSQILFYIVLVFFVLQKLKCANLVEMFEAGCDTPFKSSLPSVFVMLIIQRLIKFPLPFKKKKVYSK